jgi:hypothetical protein
MPKDRERYRYIDVGLERGSWALAMFEEDAKRHQMSDQPGKLITVRLTEYYELRKERELLASREQEPVTSGRSASRLPSDERKRDQNRTHSSEDDLLELSQHATENADEAAAYWAGV